MPIRHVPARIFIVIVWRVWIRGEKCVNLQGDLVADVMTAAVIGTPVSIYTLRKNNHDFHTESIGRILCQGSF